MKFYETPKNRKNRKTVLFIASAGCILAIGAAVWAGVSKNSGPQTVNPDNSRAESSEPAKPSYPDTSSSYDNSITDAPQSQPEPAAEPTENSVSDVPYSEPEQAMILPVKGEIIKDFSDTALQFSATYNDLRLHSAIDIGCDAGTAVYASADGEVTAIEQSAVLGNYVTVAHSNGVVFRYCGLDNIVVSAGQKLKMGDSIGTVGTVPGECADKAHLHLEAVKNEKSISPLEVIGVLN